MRKIIAISLGFAIILHPAVSLAQYIGGGSGSGGGGSGTVTSIATGCQATGGTITTTGTISTSEAVNLQAGANYAIVTGDCGKLVQLNNAGAQTPTIAAAGSAGFAAGWFTDVVNTGAGTQTITPTTSTINGAATYALAQNQGMRIVSDGANYQVQPGAGASLTMADQLVSGGANNTAFSIGTVSSGTTTIDCGKNALQFMTNNGAFTLAAPAKDGSCIVLTINGASAGAITFSGFSEGSNTGDALTTTNTQKFSLSIWRINGTSGYRVAAHQ